MSSGLNYLIFVYQISSGFSPSFQILTLRHLFFYLLKNYICTFFFCDTQNSEEANIIKLYTKKINCSPTHKISLFCLDVQSSVPSSPEADVVGLKYGNTQLQEVWTVDINYSVP